MAFMEIKIWVARASILIDLRSFALILIINVKISIFKVDAFKHVQTCNYINLTAFFQMSPLPVSAVWGVVLVAVHLLFCCL